MCKVKSGAKVKNDQDLQNMVIGIIYRQEKKYRKEKILAYVINYLKESKLKKSNNDLLDIIEENLCHLIINDEIYCENGNYYPRSIAYDYK